MTDVLSPKIPLDRDAEKLKLPAPFPSAFDVLSNRLTLPLVLDLLNAPEADEFPLSGYAPPNPLMANMPLISGTR